MVVNNQIKGSPRMPQISRCPVFTCHHLTINPADHNDRPSLHIVINTT